MRQLALLVLTGMVMALCSPVFAAEMTAEQKNECLVASRGCMNQVDTLQQKMKKLDAEIRKGNRVYSPQELQRLQDKLKEAERMMDRLLQP